MIFAEEVVKEMNERGTIEVPKGCVTGEAFEEWLANDLSKPMHFSKEQSKWIKSYVILKRQEAVDEFLSEFDKWAKTNKKLTYFWTEFVVEAQRIARQLRGAEE